MAVDEAAFVAGQEDGGEGDVVRQAGAGQRRGFGEIGFELFHLALVFFVAERLGALGAAPEDRRGDGAGGDGVDADVVLAQVGAGQAGHVGDGGLGAGIEVAALVEAVAGDAGVVDDAAAAAVLHDAGGVLDAERRGAHQQAHDAREFVFVEAVHGGAVAGAGVIEQAVQAAEFVHGEIHQGGDVVFAHDVGALEHGALAELLGQGFALLFGAARQHHGGALFDEAPGGGFADAAGGAGDDGDLVRQTITHNCSP